MKPDLNSPASVVHRLLFRALIEIREQGCEHQNQAVFKLADLFHNVVLEMETAARGQQTFDAVLSILTERAAEKGLQRWLTAANAELAKQQAQTQAVA